MVCRYNPLKTISISACRCSFFLWQPIFTHKRINRNQCKYTMLCPFLLFNRIFQVKLFQVFTFICIFSHIFCNYLFISSRLEFVIYILMYFVLLDKRETICSHLFVLTCSISFTFLVLLAILWKFIVVIVRYIVAYLLLFH